MSLVHEKAHAVIASCIMSKVDNYLLAVFRQVLRVPMIVPLNFLQNL